MTTQIIHKRINVADFQSDTNPVESELLKWFRMMPDQDQQDLLQEVQLIGYANMISLQNDEVRNGE